MDLLSPQPRRAVIHARMSEDAFESKYSFGELLGRGAFGVVSRVTPKPRNDSPGDSAHHEYACKVPCVSINHARFVSGATVHP